MIKTEDELKKIIKDLQMKKTKYWNNGLYIIVDEINFALSHLQNGIENQKTYFEEKGV